MADTGAPEDAGLALLASLASQVPGVLYQFQLFPDGRSCFPFASAALWDIYEVHPEDVRTDAQRVFDRLHPEDLEPISLSIARSAELLTPWEVEYRVLLPQQGLRWRRGLARPERLADGSTLWHGFITDITAQRQARDALAESEQRFRVLLQAAPEALLVFDTDSGRLVDVNAAAERMFAMDRATLLASSPASLSPALQPDGRPSREAAHAHNDRALAGETPVFEWTHRRSDGTDVQTEVRLVQLPSASRRLVRGSVTDITDRKRAEEELRIKDQAIATALTAIVITDATGSARYVNRAFLQMWGYDSDVEVLGQPPGAFSDPSSATRILDALQHADAWAGEIVAHRKNGTTFDILVSANVVRDQAGKVAHLMASISDITVAKRLAAQLLQSQKMESVGRLAGGVAHDFNNLLTVMRAYIDFSQSQAAEGTQLASDLAEVGRAIDSASGLTQQLLAFSRKQIISPRILNLNEAVARMHAMLRRLLGEDIDLSLTTAPDLGLVRFDANQAEQILVNLAVNARDAMPDGGRLLVETSNVVLDASYATSHPDVTPGDYVMLSVSDTGAGMSAEVKEHLFEPFFTTKESGRGTGLGLAMVYGAVTQNHGRIEVYSEPGHGTTFRIYLPRVIAEAMPKVPAARAALPGGTETVFVVEDEDAIRTLAVRILTGQGYRVEAFRSGALALRALADLTAHVDLVLTDVIMPEMKGPELVTRARELRPTLRVLFASGYTDDVIAHHGVLEVGVDFLQKPYSPAVLLRRVREALDRVS